ncbi:MAG TPA: hypothetical protein ENK09_08650 [Nitrospirae bacterium]|nr:hypothetical protein [Nitrospirota bacterium]
MESTVMYRRLSEAIESLKEAEIINDAGVSNLATLTKLYHAMIYSLMALFEIEDIGSLTHADLIERFEKEYIQKGTFRTDLLDALRFAYNFTHECDCAHMKEPEDKDIEYLMPLAEKLVRMVRNSLSETK